MTAADKAKHRAQYSDIQWANAQQMGPPQYFLGDVVEFHVGGFGVICKVNEPANGWPASYATEPAKGLPDYTKRAWHYEGDFNRLVAGSGLRALVAEMGDDDGN